MAEKLQKAFAVAEKTGGLVLLMRLAMMTGISTVSAEQLPDTEENVTRINKALKELGLPVS